MGKRRRSEEPKKQANVSNPTDDTTRGRPSATSVPLSSSPQELANQLLTSPEVFLAQRGDVKVSLLPLLQEYFIANASSGSNPSKRHAVPLSTLAVKGFDFEQIWEQIQLLNHPVQSDLNLHKKEFLNSSNSAFSLSKRRKIEDEEYSDGDDEEENEDESGDEEEFDQGEDDEEEGEGEEEEGEEEEEEKEGKGEGENEDDEDEEEESDEDERALKAYGADFETSSGKKGTKISRKDKSKKRPSALDDTFFKMHDMEAFVRQAERSEEQAMRDEEKAKDRARARASKPSRGGKVDEDDEDDEEDDEEEEEVDLFTALDDDDEEEDEAGHAMYQDFFDAPEAQDGGNSENVDVSKEEEEEEDDENAVAALDESNDLELGVKKQLFDWAGEDEEEGAPEAMLSRHEKGLREMKKKISQLETFNVGEKPWQLSGEVTSHARPLNSLLQEDLEYDQLTRPVPEITADKSRTLEEIICRRIRDHVYDDVEPRRASVEKGEGKKRIEVSDEKSKKGLAEIYEEEYLAEKDKAEGKEGPDPAEAAHKEIDSLFALLEHQIHSLTAFHYTPPAPRDEVVVVAPNVAAVKMEEVAPLGTSDVVLAAPEELYRHERGVEIGSTERTPTDLLRARRKKKIVQRLKEKERLQNKRLVEKANPGSGNKYSKQAMMEQIADFSKEKHGPKVMKRAADAGNRLSSSTFFRQLQDQESGAAKPKTKKVSSTQPSTHFKL